MFLSFDKFVVSDAALRPHISVALDFAGFFLPNATRIEDCQTSSRWSECTVNAYHLCGMHVAKGSFDGWWPYSRCLYRKQYPAEECAGLNPLDANHTCTREQFPGVMRAVSANCTATQATSLDEAAIEQCVADGTGLALLRASFAKTTTFPRNPHGYTEPQWIEVADAGASLPSCANFSGACEAAFDKTACEDWDHCDSDAWAQHLAVRARAAINNASQRDA